MENITIGQIVGAIGVFSIIGGFLTKIIMSVSKWWKANVTEKFDMVDNKFKETDERLNDLESKRAEYEAVAENSKFERKLLMGGLLSALKGLKKMGCNDAVTHSIQEIEDYMMDKIHD